MKIGDTIKDKDGKKCIITNMTKNSVEVYIEKKTKHGINCTQWFTIDKFNKRFK